MIATTLEGLMFARIITARASYIIICLGCVYVVVNATGALYWNHHDIYPFLPWCENITKAVLVGIAIAVSTTLMLWGFVSLSRRQLRSAAMQRKLEADILHAVHGEQTPVHPYH